MEALKADVTQGLEKGSKITCADNTGARELKVISTAGYSGTKNRHPKAGIGDKITVSVTKGTPEMRRQVLEAVVVRQRKSIRRPGGQRREVRGQRRRHHRRERGAPRNGD
jgi:Ribosomal protein L14